MTAPSQDDLRKIYADTKTIAVIGVSADESKASNRIPRYLQSQGYRIIPVTPKGGEILGEKAYPSLTEIEGDVDVVDVFRPAEEAPAIARDAVAIGAKVLWLQSGIESEEAERIGEDGGLVVVMDRCMGATHRQLGLGPGPD
ncbi:MAG: CoA-binding protein [Actinomycetota bacterium]